jgi:hypothetical protein
MASGIARRPARRWSGASLAVLGALLLCGCWGNMHVLDFDYHYSMNIIRRPLWFPDPKQMTAVQKEVLARYGSPDYIRFWWRTDGEFISTADLSGRDKDRVAEDMGRADKSWIYMSQNIEIVFLSEGAYRPDPMSEKLHLVCQYGDPSDKSPQVMEDGHTVQNWTWYDHGIQIKLVDGKEVKRTFFQGGGIGTDLGK